MFAVKLTPFINFAAERFGDFYCINNRLFIGNGQSARMSQTDFADVSIGSVDKRVVGAGTKHLAFGFQFDVNFEADDGDVHTSED